MSQAITPTEPERITDLAESLARLDESDGVRSIEVEPNRYPPRVRVACSRASLPEPVADRIDEFDADLVDPEVTADGLLAFDLVTPERFRPVGNHKVRAHGNSTVVTYTPEAIDESGLELGETVDLYARDGEILVHKPGGKHER